MKAVWKELFRAIHEGYWLAVEYHNQKKSDLREMLDSGQADSLQLLQVLRLLTGFTVSAAGLMR